MHDRRCPTGVWLATLLLPTLLAPGLLACGEGAFSGGELDGGPLQDAGLSDAGPTDAGPADAGPGDAGPTDAGPLDDGGVDAGPELDAGPRLPTGHADRSALLPATAESTTDLDLADLDGDGDLDLLFASQPGDDGSGLLGGVEVVRGTGSGAFVAAAEPALADFGAWTFVVAGDVDGDGDADAVLTRPSYAKREVALLRNDGTGALTPDDTSMPMITGDPEGLVFGAPVLVDVDGDGDLDLVVPVSFSNDFASDRPNLLLLNDGSGAFTVDDTGRLPAIEAGADYTVTVCAGDVTGDGSPDLYLGETERQQRLLVNDGSGRFTDETLDDGAGAARLPLDALRAYGCKIADLDGDGDRDIVVVSDSGTDASSGNPTLFDDVLLRNDGAGHFTLETLPAPGGPYDSRGLAVGDLDGDGYVDLIIGHSDTPVPHGGRALDVLLGTSAGTFEPVGGMPSWPVGIYALGLGDLDGDGRADVVGAVAVGEPGVPLTNVLLLSR